MVIIPSKAEGDLINITKEKVDKWAVDGWFDLRDKNRKLWKERFISIMKDTDKLYDDAFSSRYVFNSDYRDNFKEINIGKVFGWIFINEEKGLRMKG